MKYYLWGLTFTFLIINFSVGAKSCKLSPAADPDDNVIQDAIDSGCIIIQLDKGNYYGAIRTDNNAVYIEGNLASSADREDFVISYRKESVILVASTGELVLHRVTVTGGYDTFGNTEEETSTPIGTGPDGENLGLDDTDESVDFAAYGGCINNNNLTILDDVLLKRCKAQIGGAIYSSQNSTLTISKSRIQENEATRVGGGVMTSNLASLNIDYTTINGNVANTYAGGVYVSNPRFFEITGSSFYNNLNTIVSGTGGSGGALYANSVSAGLIENTSFTSNGIGSSQEHATVSGGAIYASGSELTLDNVNFTLNFSLKGGAGIKSTNSTLDIIDSTFLGNVVYDVTDVLSKGGAIYSSSGVLNIDKSTFLVNHAKTPSASAIASGGGVYSAGTDLSISESIFGGNTAFTGGAIVSTSTNPNRYSSAIISDSLFIQNIATNGAGGAIFASYSEVEVDHSGLIQNQASYYGGAIGLNYASLVMENSSVGENHAYSYGGGGIFAKYDSNVDLNHTTFYLNTSSYAGEALRLESNSYSTISNSLLYSDPSSGHKSCMTALSSVVTLVGNNLIGDGSCSATLTGDPQLGTSLTSTEGFYYPNTPTSPALDAASSSYCPSDDQRHRSRPIDSNGDGVAECDLGAIEGVLVTSPGSGGGLPITSTPLFQRKKRQASNLNERAQSLFINLAD
ncbi:MAG: hypothetical protein HOE90_04135 [Bacteriovoracaceae bacterium]|jgi:hypothetical protein|nr:hypothetical protein [Bacteriovoracaceae bacterium]